MKTLGSQDRPPKIPPPGTGTSYLPLAAAEDGGVAIRQSRKAEKEQGHLPNDLVALVAHGSLAVAASAPPCVASGGGLHDGGTILQGRGRGRLAVPGQHRAGFVRGVALSKRRIHSPGWAAGGAGAGGACQGPGKQLQAGAGVGMEEGSGVVRACVEARTEGSTTPSSPRSCPPGPSPLSHQARVPGLCLRMGLGCLSWAPGCEMDHSRFLSRPHLVTQGLLAPGGRSLGVEGQCCPARFQPAGQWSRAACSHLWEFILSQC